MATLGLGILSQSVAGSSTAFPWSFVSATCQRINWLSGLCEARHALARLKTIENRRTHNNPHVDVPLKSSSEGVEDKLLTVVDKQSGCAPMIVAVYLHHSCTTLQFHRVPNLRTWFGENCTTIELGGVEVEKLGVGALRFVGRLLPKGQVRRVNRSIIQHVTSVSARAAAAQERDAQQAQEVHALCI